MKLEYLTDINEHNDSLIRIFDFKINEVALLKNEIQQKVIQNKSDLDFSEIEFIEQINCKLTLRVRVQDKGILSNDKYNFFL